MLNSIFHSLDPVLVQLGPFAIRWYGLAYLVGFACAALIIYFVAKRWKLKFSSDDILIILVCAMAGVIIGARLGYCIFYGAGQYLANPLQILNLSQGGMSFHGGFVGAVIGLFIASKIIKKNFLSLCDLAAIGAPIGLFFGRCANFINGELWGAPTDLPWGVVFGGAAGTMPRHPSQLYEAILEGLVIFIVLFALSRKKPPFQQGFYSSLFLIMYGCFRFLVEFVRVPDPQLGYLLGDWFTMGQLLSIPLIIAGIILLIWSFKTRRAQDE